GLRRVICSGEALSGSLSRQFQARLPGVELHNLYGPTEAAVDVTAMACAAEQAGVGVSIGSPIANTQIYIVDEWLEAVPVGVAGEICIAGVQLGRGYLRQPGLTAQRFVANPYGAAGSRLYRTGDVGRWNAQGRIEYLGRNDQQVKIRGYRIELGEIEAQLLKHPQVKEAVVLAREGATSREGEESGAWSGGERAVGAQSHGSTEKRLVAYYVASAESAPEIGSLRSHLQQHLPEYMVPAAYVLLEQLPLTANGKLDRRALPTPTDGAYRVHEYEAPVGKLEETLAGIWQEVLGVERVGRGDNFFALGGHSLLAIQLTSRVRECLGVELSLRELFERGTFEDLANRLRRARQADQSPIPKGTRAGPLVLSLGQQRLWFLRQLEGSSAAYHITQAVRLRGRLDRAVLREVLNRIVQRHEVLRTRFVMHEGEPRQQIEGAEARFRLHEEDLRVGSNAADGSQQRLRERVEAHGREGFDLQKESGIRGLLVQLGEEEHVLAVTMHHIVSDGWSMGVLIGELTQLYGSLVRGEEPVLEPLPLQYADYAQWEREVVSGDRLQDQGRYWQEHLQGAPGVLELPRDRERPAVQDYAGESVGVRLSGEVLEGLRRLSERYGTTLYMTVLAGWAVLMSRLSGQAEVMIGTPVARRDRLELEGLIGFFVNTLVLRVDVSGSPRVGELLGRV